MSFDVNQFRSQLRFDGARPNMFKVRFLNAGDVRFDSRTEFFVNAAEIPPEQMGIIEIPYFGRRVKVPGDRTFPPWTVQIMNDEDFAIRGALENWSNLMNDHATNLRLSKKYLSDAEVIQMSKTGQEIRTYKFLNVWPSDVSPIALSWGTNDTIQEYTTTFQYDSWKVVQSATPTTTASAVSVNIGS